MDDAMVSRGYQNMDIRKYLQFLDDEGWSELIDERWKDEVKQLLTLRFPKMTAEEWNEISDVVFWNLELHTFYKRNSKKRRVFSTLNKCAKPVSTGDIIALDEDDTVAIVTRNMLESFPLFMNENISDEKKTKAIAEKDTKSFTSLIKLYETNKVIYKYYTSFRDRTKRVHSSTEIDKFLKFRPKQEEIDNFEKYLTDFWTLFIDSFDGMKEYIASSEKDAAAKFRNRETGGFLYFRPVALPQLVTAILDTCFRTKVSLEVSMSAYSKLEMCISKAPWIKVLWDSDSHTMIMKNKTLIRPLLMFMYDKDILSQKEVESLRNRYAKVLEVELTEIDERLNALLS